MLQQTEEWYAQRVGMVTASRVATILNKNPYQKLGDLIRTMVREYHGAEPEFTGNIATQWGNDHEQDGRELYVFVTGSKVTEVGFIPHPDYDWAGASPDGLVGDDGVLEIKAPYSQKIPDKPDAHYEIQCQFIMWVTGRKWCDLIYWTPDDNRIFRIDYDPDFIDFNLPFLEAFHRQYLEEINNPAHLEPLVVERTDSEFLNAADLYVVAKKALAQAQEAEKAAKQELIELAGDQSCKGGGVTVTRYTRQGSVNYKSIPELKTVNLDDYRGKPSVVYRVDA